MRRFITLVLWVGVLVAILFAFKSPLLRIYDIVHTVFRLSHEELRPPLLVPVKGIHRHGLVDSWGAPRSGGRRHEGIDIFAPCGREVISATEGIVSSVGHNNLGGQVVWVLGPGWSLHYYAHLSRYADIHRWDHVQAGDILGYVGKTGDAATTPCHLHYGIYREGGAEDPFPFLMGRRPERGPSR